MALRTIELFAGAGGLSMGGSLAGFAPVAVIEWNKWACDTVRENKERGYPLVTDWPIYEMDVREFDWDSVRESIDVVTGGPPCQPFSLGGKHLGNDDNRDMFPAAVDVVRRLRPKAFIFENVRGLTRATFAKYYQYILLQLELPEIQRKPGESWERHLWRLQSEKNSVKPHSSGLTYHVVPTLVDAANYGVPQRRERVFIVGYRSDLDIKWAFPQATHSFNALLHSQWITGEYWERHGVARRHRPSIPENLNSRIRELAESLFPLAERPWRTVRDALLGLPDPQDPESRRFRDHRFQSGAKTYPGHTGSPLDLPAKTLKAGDHGVPGGENMLIEDNGAVRYFTVRESARIQTFPDGFVFHGSWTETMRQLGNAVPVTLGHLVAKNVAAALIANEMERLSREFTLEQGAA
ncbi:MAG: DNA cytosine methyltransferase [Blastocatellia bacterium]|nr:DNA cytosine methyltransferase [Blastocatellia bacterium]